MNKAKKEPVSLESFYYIEDSTKKFEPTDEEQEILDKAQSIKWHRLEFIKESYDRSNREIAETYDINNVVPLYEKIYKKALNSFK